MIIFKYSLRLFFIYCILFSNFLNCLVIIIEEEKRKKREKGDLIKSRRKKFKNSSSRDQFLSRQDHIYDKDIEVYY